MRISLKTVFQYVGGVLLLAGCATHQRDFIPNGAAANLEPTNPAHIKVFDTMPRGMVIGAVLVDRSKAHTTDEIIALARDKAAAAGGDFIVWEDSLGTSPGPTPEPGSAPSSAPDPGTLGHSVAAVPNQQPEQTIEKTPKARFTVGIFLPDKAAPSAQ